jgi:hypothetical protein
VTKLIARTSAAALLLLLAACSQSDAPSDQMEKAAEEVVSAVEGEPAQPAAGPLAPRNECADLPGAAGFLRSLNQAIASRDAEALVALAADDVKLDFGGAGGTAELSRRLSAEDGALWDELDKLVQLGCAENTQGGITLPWYFEQSLPVDGVNGFVVTGADVPLHQAPAEDAPLVTRLSWQAVELAPGEEQEGFRHVMLPQEGPEPGEAPPTTGYVAQDNLRSLIDYRLTAASRNGRWRIISLLRGD